MTLTRCVLLRRGRVPAFDLRASSICQGVSPRGGREHTMVTGAPDLEAMASAMSSASRPCSRGWSGTSILSGCSGGPSFVRPHTGVDEQHRHSRSFPQLHCQCRLGLSASRPMRIDGEDNQSEAAGDGAHADQLGRVAGSNTPLGIGPKRLEPGGDLLQVGVGQDSAPGPVARMETLPARREPGGPDGLAGAHGIAAGSSRNNSRKHWRMRGHIRLRGSRRAAQAHGSDRTPH